MAEAVDIEPVSTVRFAENREKYRVNGVLKPKMMSPPSRSAASMGLFSEIRLKINRENIVTYQGNVDQITGQIGTLPPISALLSLFGRTHVKAWRNETHRK